MTPPKHRIDHTTRTVKAFYPSIARMVSSVEGGFILGLLMGRFHDDPDTATKHLRALDTVLCHTRRTGIIEAREYLRLHGLLEPPHRTRRRKS